jgi:hypothetical protein
MIDMQAAIIVKTPAAIGKTVRFCVAPVRAEGTKGLAQRI